MRENHSAPSSADMSASAASRKKQRSAVTLWVLTPIFVAIVAG